MGIAACCLDIFKACTRDYHARDEVDVRERNPYARETMAALLYTKHWVDAVQWHLEDIIRDPEIDAGEALRVKRRIDELNQWRTELVEQLDDRLAEEYEGIKLQPGARLNTESLAWALDRLSILDLKLFHMEQETRREGVPEEHVQRCADRLAVLAEQQADLMTAIDQLFEDLRTGRRYVRVYRQFKMYNDPTLNPVLYRRGGGKE